MRATVDDIDEALEMFKQKAPDGYVIPPTRGVNETNLTMRFTNSFGGLHPGVLPKGLGHLTKGAVTKSDTPKEDFSYIESTKSMVDLITTTCGCGNKHQSYEWGGKTIEWRNKTWLLQCAFDEAIKKLGENNKDDK